MATRRAGCARDPQSPHSRPGGHASCAAFEKPREIVGVVARPICPDPSGRRSQPPYSRVPPARFRPMAGLGPRRRDPLFSTFRPAARRPRRPAHGAIVEFPDGLRSPLPDISICTKAAIAWTCLRSAGRGSGTSADASPKTVFAAGRRPRTSVRPAIARWRLAVQVGRRLATGLRHGVAPCGGGVLA